MHSVFARCVLFGCSAEAVEALNDGYVFQPVMGQGGNKLCLRQSAGDSTDPEIHVAANVLRKGRVYGDIAEVEPASWLEDTRDFLERLLLFGNQIQHAIRDHDVGARSLDRQRSGITLTNVHLAHATGRC